MRKAIQIVLCWPIALMVVTALLWAISLVSPEVPLWGRALLMTAVLVPLMVLGVGPWAGGRADVWLGECPGRARRG